MPLQSPSDINCGAFFPDALWFDGGWDLTAEQWQAQKLIDMIRKLRSDPLINNRTGLPADFSTPEATFGHVNKPGRLWENCRTTNDNWGDISRDKRFKTGREIVQIVVKPVAGGGNLLLNVGPLPSGRIDSISTQDLNEAGAWLKANAESI